MKMMRNFMAAVMRIGHMSVVKYSLVVVIGVMVVGFVGENSLKALFRNKLYINELNEEIAKYNARSKEDLRQIRELDHNPKAIERIARERYFMKHDDEDIFVLSDDDSTPQMMPDYDENVE